MKNKFLIIILGIILISSFVSAGIGIKRTQESALVNEGDEACLSYGVYNPWPGDTYAMVGLSEELQEILIMQEVEAQLIPSETSSQEAIPIEFCFKVPKVYYRDSKLLGFVTKLDCSEEQVVYEGEVVVSTVPSPAEVFGVGGSTTQMSVSAPLRVKVNCVPYSWNYMPIYVFLALFSGLIIVLVLYKKYRTPKAERDKQKLKKLKAEIAKETKKKK